MKNSRDKLDLIIITNSPGELSTWVKSTVENLKDIRDNIRLSVFLPPCPYASGKEDHIAGNISGIDAVINPRHFMEFLLRGRTKDFTPFSKGLVVFLGGELFHAILISKRTGFPAIAYTVRSSFFNKYFLSCMVPDDRTKEKLLKSRIKEEAIKVVGNLSLAAIEVKTPRKEALKEWNLSENTLTLGFMPGSREMTFRTILCCYLKVAEEVKEKLDVQFLLGLSPYVSVDLLNDCLINIDYALEVSKGTLEKDEAGFFIRTEKGAVIRVVQNRPYDVINCCDLAICIPGTIAAEMASMGVPMIVCYSVTRPEIIPLGGISALFEVIPFIGKYLKRVLVKNILAPLILRTLKFVALPNFAAGRKIVPEVNISYYAREVSGPALELLMDEKRREDISRDLKGVYRTENAGKRVASIILEVMESML